MLHLLFVDKLTISWDNNHMKIAIKKIKQIIKEAKRNQCWFSRETGCDPAIINRILTGKVNSAGKDTIKKIYIGTGGAIEPNDWYDFVKED